MTPRLTLTVICGLLCLALGVPAAIASTDEFPLSTEFSSSNGDKLASTASGRNLVFNGDFDKGLRGWRTRGQQRLGLKESPIAARGASSAAMLTRSSKGKVLVNDATNTVQSSMARRTYVVNAFVQARGARLRGKVRVREVMGAHRLASGVAKFTATQTGWTQVRVEYVARRAGTQLDLNVLARGVKPGVSLLVDNISMYLQAKTVPEAPPPPVVPPSSSPPIATPADPATGCVTDPMGIPTNGAYLGAAVNGTSNLATREAQLGQTLALHRTYYSAGQISTAVKNAKSDLALGRQPWISFKAPYSWSAMAAGAGNAWSAQLADALKTVPGPVWLAIHHEPENDGNMAEWTAMQARIAPIIHQRTDNVAYSVIYSGWNTFGGDKNTIATKWPGDANIDILAIDAYNDFGATRGSHTGTKSLDLRTYYAKMAAWSRDHQTAWAIGETGQTRKASAVDPNWLDRTYRDLVAAGGAGLSYYDSSANSVADWTLDDPVKFARFKALLAESQRLC